MPTAESLCCGTPVAGFLAGGPESIAFPEYSSFVQYGDIPHLKAEIRKMLSMKFDSDEMSERAMARYSKSRMASEYLKLINTIK